MGFKSTRHIHNEIEEDHTKDQFQTSRSSSSTYHHSQSTTAQSPYNKDVTSRPKQIAITNSTSSPRVASVGKCVSAGSRTSRAGGTAKNKEKTPEDREFEHQEMMSVRNLVNKNILTNANIEIHEHTPGTMYQDIYIRKEKLGSGTFASVFETYDWRVRRSFAVKVLSLENFDHEHVKRVKRMIISEIENTALTQCPNVVKMHRVHFTDNAVLLVLDLHRGGTLWDKRSKRTNPISFLEFAQLVQGIYFMQESGVVHRDLKPTNLLRSEDSAWVTICDFGWSETEDKLRSSRTKEWPGTLEINPPEVIDLQINEWTVKIDNYALGLNWLLLNWGVFVCRPKDTRGKEAARVILETIKKNRKALKHKEDESSGWTVFKGLTRPVPTRRYGLEEVIMSQWFRDSINNLMLPDYQNYLWHPRIKSIAEMNKLYRTLSTQDTPSRLVNLASEESTAQKPTYKGKYSNEQKHETAKNISPWRVSQK